MHIFVIAVAFCCLVAWYWKRPLYELAWRSVLLRIEKLRLSCENLKKFLQRCIFHDFRFFSFVFISAFLVLLIHSSYPLVPCQGYRQEEVVSNSTAGLIEASLSYKVITSLCVVCCAASVGLSFRWQLISLSASNRCLYSSFVFILLQWIFLFYIAVIGLHSIVLLLIWSLRFSPYCCIF